MNWNGIMNVNELGFQIKASTYHWEGGGGRGREEEGGLGYCFLDLPS